MQEADLVCGICGAHGGYETAEVRDVRRNGGGRGLLCEGPGKIVDGVLDDLRDFGINVDQWTTAAQDEGAWRRTAEQGAEHFIYRRSDSHTCFFLFLFFLFFVYLFGDVAFSEYFSRFLFVWRVRRTFVPSGWCFFYLVTTSWIFNISLLCENSINQSRLPILLVVSS